MAFKLRTPPLPEPKTFRDPAQAVQELRQLYETATGFLQEKFSEFLQGKEPEGRFRAYYPEIRVLV